ncbi:hypothetical protein BpHYR1_053887 [Brachionus plicatilis]|uniref:Uncharacterized protein n=1 Tax=Brachionus plicatilis TaxID=10195 RepID=A0A3M7T1C4_BRAPC|nr:hypothetical protein BpHYR1_053887 [Brachionus plicatilis]
MELIMQKQQQDQLNWSCWSDVLDSFFVYKKVRFFGDKKTLKKLHSLVQFQSYHFALQILNQKFYHITINVFYNSFNYTFILKIKPPIVVLSPSIPLTSLPFSSTNPPIQFSLGVYCVPHVNGVDMITYFRGFTKVLSRFKNFIGSVNRQTKFDASTRSNSPKSSLKLQASPTSKLNLSTFTSGSNLLLLRRKFQDNDHGITKQRSGETRHNCGYQNIGSIRTG